MATPTASVRPQSVGNGLHAQGETWAEPCEEDRGRLIEIEAPAEEKDASKLQRTLPVAKWLGITAFQMVYVCVSTGMGVIVLPQEAERFHQPNSSMWVGVYMGISGSTQLICPVVGKLSDRHRSSWGRRRPFIATGSILAVLGLLLMRAASANLLPTLFVLALLGLQLAVNGVYAAQCGLPADFLDTVESSGSDKAVVSGLVAMYTFLGSLLSMTIVILTRNMPIQIHYLIYVATILVVAMLVCYCATEASSLNSTPGSLSLADIRRTYLIDPSKDADFAWVCAGRMCYYVSTSVAAFMYYYFRDMMHVETESRRRMVIGLLAIVMQCVGMLAAVPLGRLSNRWGRKPVIYISCMFMSCTFLLYVLAPLNAKTSWPAVVAAAVFYGIGSGAYLSVDYALALDCLPKGKTAAEALGLWGVIGFLGSTMGPVIGGVLLSFSQPAGADASQYPFSGYALLMLLLGCGMNLLLVVLTQQITGVR